MYDSVGKLLDGERKSLGPSVVAKSCFSGHVIMSIGKQILNGRAILLL